MNTIAITLGLRTAPPLQGIAHEYVDGKPKQEHRWTIGDDGLTQGQRTRQRIMALVDEWTEIDINFVTAELEISRRGAQLQLARLVASGTLQRHEPGRQGGGQAILWTRRAA